MNPVIYGLSRNAGRILGLACCGALYNNGFEFVNSRALGFPCFCLLVSLKHTQILEESSAIATTAVRSQQLTDALAVISKLILLEKKSA